MRSIEQTIRDLPRAGRWLLIAAGAFVGYFAIVQPVLDTILNLNGRAAGARSELGYEGRERAAREQAGAEVRAGTGMFGTVAFPGEAAERSQAFNRRINEVLSKNAVTGDRRITRTAPMEPGAMDAFAGQNKRVDRLIMDIQFNASPEQVSAVLADLESSPEIAAISRVQLRRETGSEGGAAPGRTLRVNLSAEAWLLSRKEGGG